MKMICSNKKLHDQRKGQWLYNRIRENQLWKNEKENVADTLWNMSNECFDYLMKEYYLVKKNEVSK